MYVEKPEEDCGCSMQQIDVDLNVVLDKLKSNSEIFLVMNIVIELYIDCINTMSKPVDDYGQA
jgi:hypothetical protein